VPVQRFYGGLDRNELKAGAAVAAAAAHQAGRTRTFTGRTRPMSPRRRRDLSGLMSLSGNSARTNEASQGRIVRRTSESVCRR